MEPSTLLTSVISKPQSANHLDIQPLSSRHAQHAPKLSKPKISKSTTENSVNSKLHFQEVIDGFRASRGNSNSYVSQCFSTQKYSSIAHVNARSTNNDERITTNNHEQMRMLNENKAAKTLAIVVGGFIICWLPFFLMYVLEAVLPPGSITKTMSDTITWLGYFNSAVNPVIYAYCSKQFRSAFYRITIGKFKEDSIRIRSPSYLNSYQRNTNYYYQDKKFVQHRLYYNNSVIYNNKNCRV